MELTSTALSVLYRAFIPEQEDDAIRHLKVTKKVRRTEYNLTLFESVPMDSTAGPDILPTFRADRHSLGIAYNHFYWLPDFHFRCTRARAIPAYPWFFVSGLDCNVPCFYYYPSLFYASSNLSVYI